MSVLQKKIRGFTLMEAMVAIVILSVSVVAPISIAQKGLQSTYFARDQITAFYMAQEAIEYIRSNRDNAILQGGSWAGTFLPAVSTCVSAGLTSKCYVDLYNSGGNFNPSITSCGGTCPVIKFHPSKYIYGYGLSGATNTKYTRDIKIQNPSGGSADEAKIVVTVSWTSQIGLKTVSITSFLRNL